jgi:pimeloyl-[acyl-carrier protein] methyl ester esterase
MRLNVDGSKSIYFEHHQRGGRPIVLVHGTWVTAHCWDTVLSSLLGAGHDVVTLDLRGHGRSDADFDDVTIDTLGRDVAGLVRHLGLHGVVLNGWSLGGAVVVAAARDLGADVAGLVLTSAATPRYTPADGWPYGIPAEGIDALLTALADDRATTFRGIAAGVFAKPAGQDVVDGIWQQFMLSSPRADDCLRSLAAIDQRSIAADLSCPVLLCVGTGDAGVIDWVRASQRIYKDATLVEFEGAGHAPFLEDVAAYRRELLGFLAAL